MSYAYILHSFQWEFCIKDIFEILNRQPIPLINYFAASYMSDSYAKGLNTESKSLVCNYDTESVLYSLKVPLQHYFHISGKDKTFLTHSAQFPCLARTL